MNAAQNTAFLANAGFTPADMSRVALGVVFAVLLVWGAWAMKSAWSGWAERHLSQGQCLGVVIRFLAMYLVLGFFLLS
jgi:integrating conjugative element protein (TIGR03758 family)